MVTNVQPSARGVVCPDARLDHKEERPVPPGEDEKRGPRIQTRGYEAPEPQVYELSTTQRRLWLLEQLFPEKPLNRLLLGICFQGDLDVERLESALNEVVARQKSLRLRITNQDGVLAANVMTAPAVHMRRIDLSDGSPGQHQREWHNLLTSEISGQGDETTLPRATLVKLEEKEHRLLLCLTELGIGRGALAQFYRDLARSYAEGCSRGNAAPESNSLAGSGHNDLPNVSALNLPSDRPRPAVMSFRCGYERFAPETFAALTDFAGRKGVPRRVIMLTALSALLHRYTGQEQIVIGSTVTSWQRRSMEPATAPVVFDIALSGKETFSAVLTRVRHELSSAITYSGAAFDRGVTKLESDVSRHPVFQVGFEWLDNFEKIELPGLTLSAEELATGHAKLDLTFVFRRSAGSLEGSLEYNTDLFDATTARRMAEHLGVVLRAVTANPDQPISRLPVLSDRERGQILEGWNATAVAYEAKCVHELFEEQVRRTPQTVALVFRDQELTYGELNRRANKLAARLREMGIGPDRLVGVCVERSPAMFVSQLAILKAGGAYVPLDPAYPAERLAFMASNAELAALITQEQFVSVFNLPEARLLRIDQFEWQTSDEHESAPHSGAELENLAYVIYTSGSTGKPKGVMITHRNVANFFAGMDAVIGREAGIWLAVTSICFDISVLELFWTTARGFKVVLQPDKNAIDEEASSISAQILRQRVTHFQCTPSLAGVLLLEPKGLDALRSVGKVLLGGEAMPPWLAEKLIGAGQLINVYGPTETTVWSASTEVNSSEGITIGRPIANTQIYILDPNLEPVPAGISGEIYIGGTGVARGYLNRPELTTERFIPNPFSSRPGERIYRTGDLGRFLSDGRIECLGRADFQVKVRGFRIELGEIENALREHPSVRDAVVSVREYSPGDKRFLAYCVPANGAAPGAPEFRRFLKERLPEYMIPSAFINLPVLPLTPNGKVDRKALPSVEENPDRHAPLRTAQEKVLAGIWRQILKVDNVDGDSNFFTLNGSAFDLLRVQALLRERFAVSVPLRPLVQAASLSAQAQLVTEALAREEARVQWMPLSEGQKEVWLASQESDKASCVFNISTVLRLSGSIDLERLAKSIQQITDRHPSLRTTMKADGTAQRIASHLATNVPLDDWSAETHDQTSRLDSVLQVEAARAFDLFRGPLFRWRLIRMSEQEHVAVFTVHHIIADAHAVEVILEELGALYSGKPLTEIRPPDVQVPAEGSQEYWLSQYAAAVTPTELPADRPKPSMPTYRAGLCAQTLPKELRQQLEQVAANHRASPEAVLLSGYHVLLHKLTNQPEVTLGLRAHRGERVVADAVSFLPLRLGVREEDRFSEHLAKVMEIHEAALSHSDFPLGTLARILIERGEPHRIPSINLAFAFHKAAPPPQFGSANAVICANPQGFTKMDLDVQIFAESDAWRIQCLFNSDILDDGTVARWLRHFETLLQNIVSAPQLPISELRLLRPEERQQIVETWNATELAYPRQLCLHQPFEAQAAATPQAVALIVGERAVTYGELNARANQLARYLVKRGARPDQLIGVWLDRTEELVVALLGVLKSGAAYLPLDAGYPRERLRYMLQDTKAKLLITQSHWLAHLPEYSGETICLDAAHAAISAENGANREGQAVENGRGLAYVIYTSGSTGRPKGVAIEHASATAFVHWAREVFTPEELAGTLASTSICFDLSIFELFAPLSWGGTVILAENIMQLPHLPAANRVTLVNTVPSAAGDLLRAGSIPKSATTFALAGEPLTPRMVDDLYALPHVAKVFDLYGPSETTTYSTFTLRQRGARATVGKPLANTQIYIVDARLEPVPIGVPGEICIGGAGLARGYLNAPEATIQKFVPDPFRPESRMYRTGDLGRWLPNGEIEFLGRRDHQVKIRGYRIELGEIEAVMAAHPAVRESAAVVQSDKLAGYAVVEASSALTVGDFRHYLREKLPDYMVPSALMFLEALPRTPSGKVDRKSLPLPATASLQSTVLAEVEMTPLEETLAHIWREVIGVASVGVEDNFFDLGGHSVLVVQVLARVRAALQVELTLRNLFEAPTLREFAKVIEEKLVEEMGLLSEAEESKEAALL